MMKKLNLLSRAEMKNVMGGNVPVSELEGSGCRIATRNADGSWRGWSYANYSVSEAQNAYNSGETYSDGSYVSGYCCASCEY